MDFLWNKVTEWLKEMLIGSIMGNLTGLFDSVNEQVSEIATTVGTTPQGWNAGVFSMIQSLSETVIVPIAGIILTFVMTYELIQMIIDRNNMHDFETFMFFKWIFKTFVAVTIVTNTWNIVMAVFDVAQHGVFVGMVEDFFGWQREKPLSVMFLRGKALFIKAGVQFFIGHGQRTSVSCSFFPVPLQGR